MPCNSELFPQTLMALQHLVLPTILSANSSHPHPFAPARISWNTPSAFPMALNSVLHSFPAGSFLSIGTRHRAPSGSPCLFVLCPHLRVVISPHGGPSCTPAPLQLRSPRAPYLPRQGNTAHLHVASQEDHQLHRSKTGLIIFLPKLVLPQNSGRHLKLLYLS